MLKKSISLEPNKNAEKYMTIAQLSDCKTALKYYEKGIFIFEEEYKNNKAISSSLASAYSSVAELFMKTDLW
jgi:hypothetical protein